MRRDQRGLRFAGVARAVDARRLRCILSTALLVIAAGCGSKGRTGDAQGKGGTTNAASASAALTHEEWELNNKGLAYLEQFDTPGSGGTNGYTKAVETFEELVKRRPDWLPGKFNLAVAKINASQADENLYAAEDLLREVIQSEPDHAKARYTLGYLLQYRTRLDEAREQFEKVCMELAPGDAHAWVRLGDCLGDDEGPNGMSAMDCYERALELNPYLTAAMHKLQLALRLAGRPECANEVMQRRNALNATLNYSEYSDPYLWAGPLTEAIGAKPPSARADTRPLPVYEVWQEARFVLAEGARWATADDFSAVEHGELLRRIRERFGAGVAVFDYDRDDDLDVLLLASAVEGGLVRNALFRNWGDGRFEDVTGEAGLAGLAAGIGCTIGDFDADGYSDVYLTAPGGNRLLRNTGEGGFEDVTEAAGVAEAGLVSLGAAFLDVDHDSDLDLLVANYGPLDDAGRMFGDETYDGGAANALFVNVGKARLEGQGETGPAGALEVAFERAEEAVIAEPAAPSVGFAAADWDNDRDLDVLEINDSLPCRLLINKRLMRWEAAELTGPSVPAGRYNGGLVADVNNDTNIDLVLVSPEGAARVLENDASRAQVDEVPEFQPVATDVTNVRAAQACDVDCDGWTDLLTLPADAKAPLLAANRGRGLLRQEWIEPLIDQGGPISGVMAAELSGGAWPQLLVLRAGEAPTVLSTEGNASHWVALRLTGKPQRVPSPDKKTMRTNPDAIGTRVMVHSGPNVVTWEQTTLSAGLCQGLMPLRVGLGARTQGDAVRLRWPDGVEQAELSLPADQVVTIDETQRRGTSCPLLFAYNGERFEFITDFLGGGGIGYLVAPGVYSEPDPDEDVKIEPDQLAADDQGRLVLKIAEPMDEMTYLDAALLEVVDHPAELTVHPDERFHPASPHPSGGRIVFGPRIEPIAARDHRGHDLRDVLAARDRRTADGFRTSAMWIGYAEEHFVELDFADAFAELKHDEPVALVLAGWVEYPYSETNWAAATAGVTLEPPVLEWLDTDGAWHVLDGNMGYPAGLPRVMTLDLTGKLPQAVRDGAPCRLRIRTNMEIYWDEIFAARLLPEKHVKRTVLPPTTASLGYRGYLQEYSPDGRLPRLFDYDQIVSVPLVGLEGQRTAYGDVRELVSGVDERFALINAGDEVTLSYDASVLPELPDGWTRSYILRTHGYCKEGGLFNPTGRTVEPLPGRSHGVSASPASVPPSEAGS